MSRPNASVDIVLDQGSPRAVASAEAYGSDFYAWTLAQRASRSWHGTISHQRIEIARLLKDSPSLKTKRAALFEEGYEDARRQTAVETGFNVDVFPKAPPPFTIDQAETEGWLP